jgi:hypothetical protein
VIHQWEGFGNGLIYLSSALLPNGINCYAKLGADMTWVASIDDAHIQNSALDRLHQLSSITSILLTTIDVSLLQGSSVIVALEIKA